MIGRWSRCSRVLHAEQGEDQKQHHGADPDHHVPVHECHLYSLSVQSAWQGFLTIE